MKKILLIILTMVTGHLFAQEVPGFGFDKVRIVLPDKIIQAETLPAGSAPTAKIGLFYYWYSANAIHYTQGGFSGRLLNGLYTEYYSDKNLKEQGRFDKGLKTGPWKDWNDDGTIINVKNWKNGTLLADTAASFWKRINIFKKKKNKPVIAAQ
ncbi:toxin-antitoxin system YwqK family antitoxin [Mucilaginibacter sp.]|uniref:toxin-antitoxin system YwqK family antitoxin n=1 Tax=Mucilaginibacter sp. TaxID=1882438 RepID=UPI003D11DC41